MGENLDKLRVLTETLTVRDQKRLQELSLYQSFFESIPVRTFVWSVDSNLNIRTKNKKSLKGKCFGTIMPNGSLNDAFSCDKMNKMNINRHKQALAGDKQTYLSYEGEFTFLTTLLPIVENKETVVYGCSWDVTNAVAILDAVEDLRGLGKAFPIDALTGVVDRSEMFKLLRGLRSDV